MRTVGKIFVILFVAALVVGTYFGVHVVLSWITEDENAWRVEITISSINIRADHSQYEEKIGVAKEGNRYKVLSQYLEDKQYVWYEISLGRNQSGWIASSRKTPYVKEYNSPNAEETTDTDQESIVDYNPPTLKILLDVYEFNTINDVNYDNVYVKDESHYTLSHKVFYEEHPEPEENNPNPPPQYWIQFIAVDDYGNTTKKVQHVVFKVEPKRSEVLDFSELVR